jgi:predicted esterase
VKAPLVFALHGLGGTHTSLLRGNALVPTLATKRSMGRASNGRPASDTSTEIPESVSISNTR